MWSIKFFYSHQRVPYFRRNYLKAIRLQPISHRISPRTPQFWTTKIIRRSTYAPIRGISSRWHFGELEDPPLAPSRWERSSRDVNSIGEASATQDTLISEDRGWAWATRQGGSGVLQLVLLAKGCLWERRLYRVRAVWIQTRSGWKGPARLPEISEDQKLKLDLPRARLQLSLYDYLRTSYHQRLLSQRKGIGAALPREPSSLAAILRPMH